MLIFDAGCRSETLIVLKARTFASLGLLGFFPFFMKLKLPQFSRCYTYGIAEATRNACHAIKGAGPIQRTWTSTAVIFWWIVETFSQGHYPAEHIYSFACFCLDCACSVENAANLNCSYITVIPLPTFFQQQSLRGLPWAITFSAGDAISLHLPLLLGEE